MAVLQRRLRGDLRSAARMAMAMAMAMAKAEVEVMTKAMTMVRRMAFASLEDESQFRGENKDAFQVRKCQP
jgi:hypothetical protein